MKRQLSIYGDVNHIDHFHLSSYGIPAVNYSRDMEAFPLLKRIIEKITKKPSFYQSPTDMGVNRVGFGIINDAVVREASNQEIIRRYFATLSEYAQGSGSSDAVTRIKLLLESMNLSPTMRSVVVASHEELKSAVERGKGHDGSCERVSNRS